MICLLQNSLYRMSGISPRTVLCQHSINETKHHEKLSSDTDLTLVHFTNDEIHVDRRMSGSRQKSRPTLIYLACFLIILKQLLARFPPTESCCVSSKLGTCRIYNTLDWLFEVVMRRLSVTFTAFMSTHIPLVYLAKYQI